MSDTSGSPQAVALKGREALRLMRDNFVIISGAAVILGVGLATIFLATYLSSFDWHLLWFVQYTDVLTFGLIALGLISGALGILINVVQISTDWFKVSAQSRRLFIVICVVLSAVGVAFEVWGAYHRGEGIFHVVWGAIVIAFGIAIVVTMVAILRYINTGRALNTGPIVWMLIIFVVIEAGGLGKWLGYSVLETGNLVDIKTKDSTMSGMKIIVVMSRHTILMKDKDIYVVPTSDIAQFHGAVPPP